MTSYEDEEYEVPLKDRRYFGAGLKRKRVQFVQSSQAGTLPSGLGVKESSGSSTSDAYLRIVLGSRNGHPKEAPETKRSPHLLNNPAQGLARFDGNETNASNDGHGARCSVCHLPVDVGEGLAGHESTIAHQVCLPHSHPPSALDRQRKGLNILQSHGWDPDLRQGLGSTGEGILHPVRGKEKSNRHGLGHGVETTERGRKRNSVAPAKRTIEKLDAGKVRALDDERRKQDRRMRDLFYRDEDLEKYLGGG